MKFTQYSILINLCILTILVCASQAYDFFFFAQQWPGSLCDTKKACCYPKTGKPAADFGIHGLWPTYNNHSFPGNCNRNSGFDGSEISDLRERMQVSWPSLNCPSSNSSKFWKHEWVKHGTCSESVLDQHGYFEAALSIKEHSVNLLQILQSAGIQPDGKSYNLESIREAIKKGSGFSPVIECNVNASGNYQLSRSTFA
ncbi:hypothetical protein FNV43_RR26198 [Rhamnella rubrinervis]|uniref:Uncharacterized protein n=1 Tax=Rhamnella rubrinervis TaxID=2594499 RepID=A0A8K0DUJ1_9ROSA|nr:hypothetical protein FNV43_RR26198 [Rhamnella rubrinervis]